MFVAPDCPYCKKASTLYEDSGVVYHGRNFGPVYACLPCEAWVGCHKGTTNPMGRLANKELRDWKRKAHNYFDPLWKARRAQGVKNARSKGYAWLAAGMRLKPEECHIGMFDVAQCKEVVALCEPWLRDWMDA